MSVGAEALRLAVEYKLEGIAAASGALAVSMGTYWLRRHDDDKATKAATKIAFFGSAALSIAMTGFAILHGHAPALPDTSPTASAPQPLAAGDGPPSAGPPDKVAAPPASGALIAPPPAKDSPVEGASIPDVHGSGAQTITRRFDNPVKFNNAENRNNGLSECLAVDILSGKLSGCGGEAASRFCADNGFRREIGYDVEPVSRDEVLYFIGHGTFAEVGMLDEPAPGKPYPVWNKFTNIACEK
jgi:hypothetical protein